MHSKAMILIGLCIGLSGAAFAEGSPFRSTVRGLTIGNAHVVGGNSRAQIIRGSAPLGKADELARFGVDEVLIIKNETRNEVQREISELVAAGIPRSSIKHIPYRYVDLESFSVACRQTIDALRFILTAQSRGRTVFYHCTAGEDRTGLVSALIRMLTQRVSTSDAFKGEMCENGFEAGNRNKPRQVVAAIRQELTPLFLHLAMKIRDGSLSLRRLDYSACGAEPEVAEAVVQRYRCQTSSRFRAR